MSFSIEYLAYKWRSLLKLAIPSLVIVDTVRSFYVVSQLAQERLKEWKKEEEEKIVSSTRLILQQAIVRCHAQDGDFFPKILTQRARIPSFPSDTTSSSPSPTRASDTRITDPINELFFTSSINNNASSSTLNTAAIEQQQTSASGIHHPQTTRSAPTNTKNNTTKPHTRQIIEYVTLEDCWVHLTQTIHLLSSSVATQSMQSKVFQTLRDHTNYIDAKALAAADILRCWGQTWPEITVTRKSALRCSLSYASSTKEKNIAQKEAYNTNSLDIEISSF